LEPGHIGAAVEIAPLEVEDDADELVEELEDACDELELTLDEVVALDEELAFELEDELELALDDELAFELEDEDELAVVVALELEILDDDVELACDELDVCGCEMLTECQIYISSLPGPPQNSLELPLQVMLHCKLPSGAGPPPFMSALPQ